MEPAQIVEELGVQGRLPVEAIRAAQADRATMVPVFLRTLEDFLSLEGPADPDALFFIFHLLGEWRENRHTGRWRFSCACRPTFSTASSAMPSR